MRFEIALFGAWRDRLQHDSSHEADFAELGTVRFENAPSRAREALRKMADRHPGGRPVGGDGAATTVGCIHLHGPTATMNPAEALRQVCEMVTDGDLASASETLTSAFSAPSAQTPRGTWARSRLIKVFVRDGFTDRYFGEPLVFPGTLRALSVLAPSAFPYHPNWKQSLTHPAYWTHYPTIDHIIPVARGGLDDESNIVTTTMLRNAAKGNWLSSELGWPAEQAPVRADWDGLLPWFCREYERNEKLRHELSLQQWYRAAKSAA